MRLACLCVELGVATTTYVHCDITVEAYVVVVVDHAVAAFGTLDDIPSMRRHGDSATSPVCGDAIRGWLLCPAMTMPTSRRRWRANSSTDS
jgi:hypothetical protein